MRLYDICNPRTPAFHGQSRLLEHQGHVVAATQAYAWLVGMSLERADQSLSRYGAVLRARHGRCKPPTSLLRQLESAAQWKRP